MFFTPLFCFAVLLAAHLSIICYNHPVWLQLQSKCCKQVSEFCVCLFSFFFYSYLYSPLLINNTEKGIWLFFFSHTNCIPLFPFFFSSAVSAIIYFFFSFISFVHSLSALYSPAASHWITVPIWNSLCCSAAAEVQLSIKFSVFFFSLLLLLLSAETCFLL